MLNFKVEKMDKAIEWVCANYKVLIFAGVAMLIIAYTVVSLKGGNKLWKN